MTTRVARWPFAALAISTAGALALLTAPNDRSGRHRLESGTTAAWDAWILDADVTGTITLGAR